MTRIRLCLLIPAYLFVPVLVRADNEILVLTRLSEVHPEWIPNGIIDVGSNSGGWTRRAAPFLNNAKFLMIEATESHKDSLQKTVEELDRPAAYRIAVLSEKDGDNITFYQSLNTGNSMFKEQTVHYKNDAGTSRTTSTLDTIVREESLFKDGEPIDYLKLDVQGAELVVLKGARQVLQQVTFVQFEASLVEYNQDGACWNEVDDLLRSHGFYFYDFGETNRVPSAFHTKGPGQVDMLYIRPTSARAPEYYQQTRFCGMSSQLNKDPEVSTATSNDVRLSAVDDITTNQFSSVLLLIGFLLGYGAACCRLGRNHGRDKRRT